MTAVLGRLCELTPGRLLLRVWLALLGVTVIAAIPHPVTAFLGLSAGLLVMFGYSIIVVLGLPCHAGRLARGIVQCSALAFVVLGLLAGLDRAGWYQPGSLRIFEPIVAAFALAPSFVATHVIGEARRAAGMYKPTDFIGTWLVLYFFAFGGAWWAHRQARTVVHGLLHAGGTR